MHLKLIYSDIDELGHFQYKGSLGQALCVFWLGGGGRERAWDIIIYDMGQRLIKMLQFWELSPFPSQHSGGQIGDNSRNYGKLFSIFLY